MQVLGLSLSAGALYFSARENAVAAPWRVLWAWLRQFPAWRKPPTQAVGTVSIGPLSMTGLARGSSSPPTSFTTEQKLMWLKEVVDGLHAALVETVNATNVRLDHVESQLGKISDHMDRSTIQIEEKIRSLSASNFYQVFAGLALLSVGSILSLFLS